MMHKVILTRGIQGSGKSTYAKKWVLEDPEHRIRINNDDIRNMLGKYWVPSREIIVTEAKERILDLATSLGYDIIIDNMNLNPKEVARIKSMIPANYEVEFKDFFIPLETCIERDSKRDNPIGEKVIRSTYEKYKDIIEG
jgi:predicted kinase